MSECAFIFLNLRYPPLFINQAMKRAHKISNKKNTPAPQTPTRYIRVTTNSLSVPISNNFKNPSLRIVTCTSKTIKELIKPPSPAPNEESCSGCIYAIPCKKCSKIYIGETGRALKTRVDEHKRALRRNDLSNALTQHRNNFNHNFDLKNAVKLQLINDPIRRKTIEAATIMNFNTIKQKMGRINLHENVAYSILKENKILHFKNKINSPTVTTPPPPT